MSRPGVDAAVIGAGPAGSAAAIRLAGAGFRVALLEKDVFPRHKVCGEFLSDAAREPLELLAARELVERAGPARIDRGRIAPSRGEAVEFALPAPAYGISRFALDSLLAGRAAAAGADVRFGARVLSAEGSPASGFLLRLAEEGGIREMTARVVIGAWGRWDALDRTLERGFLGRRGKFFGWSLDLTGGPDELAREVRLYLFPGGYCGLSRVEAGGVNLAGVISERARRSLAPGWPAVLAHARARNPSLDRDLRDFGEGPRGFLGTGPVYFTAKPPTEEGILMTGDAAGVIDPFSGQGQTAALVSGILAADAAAASLAGALAPSALLAAYAAAWRRRFARRFVWSAVFRRAMLHPLLASSLARLIGPRFVTLALRRIA